jgi:ribonuclease HII
MSIICGLDEVGRGALAGPMVLCAVCLEENINLKEKLKNFKFRDSKKMTRLQREDIFSVLTSLVVSFELETISVSEINEKGVGVCNRLGFERLISKVRADKYVVDGNLKINNAKSVVKADSFIDSVTAAGIIAKVIRDKMMYGLHNLFPEYDYLNNVGYGTKKHIEAIKKFGKTEHHRDLFLRKII